MSRYILVGLFGVMLASVFGCEKSKLQEDVTGDSTWETSEGGEPPWDQQGERATPDEEWEKEHAPMEGAPPEEQKPESRLIEDYPRVTSGVIARAELLPVLDDGLGRFLQNVKTEPAFQKGAFVGFRIVSLFPGNPTFASLDLRAGDTVTRINGKPIARPEQAAAVWDELRTASQLVVDYRRQEARHSLRFAIIDER